ncbi:GGDEF domain-containing protein [Rubellimicrobium aerolatum]|uniref:diguanylate cyclase n=1 Tax=Rubellimicrobium aerolatum TaxID=490979 RepID=A0ABW0SED8_9RHOB|nr:GGDEF domain-containing protein [Rubellimicrobium aerolatum]MBP1805676.1 two-component system cell cycle response regulator [Rubellimicrobium aerolatum]
MMMGGAILIVDGSAARRARLRAALGDAAGPVEDCGDPDALPALAARLRPALVLLDLGARPGRALAAAARLRDGTGPTPPVLALAPPGDAAPRLAALRAGLDGVTGRATPPRLLQARVRALLRAEPLLALAPPPEGRPGPEEIRPDAIRPDAIRPDAIRPIEIRPAAPPRVLLLSARPDAAAMAQNLARHLGGPVAPVPLAPALPPGPPPDLLILDAAGTRGDLAQGARVLALLADLLGREGSRDAATLLLLPASAPETAALALDLGAGEVLAPDPAPDPDADPDPVPEEVALLARALLARRARGLRLRAGLRSRLRAAVTDPLTGLHNLRHANPALARLAAEAARDGAGLAVLMVDIDHFKQVNDRLGHAAGDRVLAVVARRLRARLRRGDLLARVGGEEFRAVLPGASLADARAVAEELRRAVRARPVVLPPTCPPRPAPHQPAPHRPAPPEEPPTLPVTVSIGVAAATAEELAAGLAPSALVARADAALYAAKAAGRDRVESAFPA